MNHPLPLWTLLLLGASSALAVATPACDPPVYDITEEAGPPPAPTDAKSDVVVVDTTTCLACVDAPDMPGPGCGNESAACQADDQCSSLFACVLASGCIGGPPSTFITCALPCANEAGGIPASAAALFECLANGACAKACVTK
jgi:hypothetical protein